MYKLNLKNILDQKSKSQYWLSKQTGIARNNISKIYHGQTNTIRLDSLYKICKALDCTPNDIICEVKGDTE